MHSLNQKSWQGNTILALLTLAVAVVAAMAVSDTRQTADNAMPPPANRTISGLEVSDLSVSGFRVGSLAVFLVNDLFSSTRTLRDSSGAPTTTQTSPAGQLVTATTTTVKAKADTSPSPLTIPPTTSPDRPTLTIPASSTSSTQPDSSSSTSVVANTPTTESIATTTTTKRVPSTTIAGPPPASDEPSEESLEPEDSLTIFGQPYLVTWPTLEMWERMAWCESRNTWDVDTGNGYYGGLQFALGSWQWMGGEGNPADATKAEQIYRANLLWQAQGWNGWPGCKAYFGWSRWQISQ